MQNRIVITKNNNQYIVLFIKNDITVKIKCFNEITERYGQVFLGRVNKVKSNISASFIKYNDQMGYFPSASIKPETVFPVMEKKVNSGNKENELTDVLSITGIYCVISDCINGVKYSKNLSDRFIKSLDANKFNKVIIRTNAKNADVDSIYNEYVYLNSIYNHIKNISDKRTENCILYNGIPKIINYIFSEDISNYDEIITDDLEAYNTINSFVEDYKFHNINLNIKVVEYKDSLVSLKALISYSSIIERATSRKVYLKSDAYLVFDYTEAMNVIDVNSGTTRFKGTKSEVVHNINLEAAKEIALQLKLRNLSGIIIVDFINNTEKEYDEELISVLKTELKKDDCHAKCHGMTKLGLIEITRERIEKPLREQLWK